MTDGFTMVATVFGDRAGLLTVCADIHIDSLVSFMSSSSFWSSSRTIASGYLSVNTGFRPFKGIDKRIAIGYSRGMNLKEWRIKYGRQALNDLAERIGYNSEYLAQCVSGFRRPGHDLCWKLVKEAPELTTHDLRPDIFGPSPGRAA